MDSLKDETKVGTRQPQGFYKMTKYSHNEKTHFDPVFHFSVEITTSKRVLYFSIYVQTTLDKMYMNK